MEAGFCLCLHAFIYARVYVVQVVRPDGSREEVVIVRGEA